MPKSSLRGGAKAHRKRSQQRTLSIRRQKEKAQREFMNMIMEMKQKQYDEQSKEQDHNIVDVEQLGDIGDFKIDEIEVSNETKE